MTSKFKYDLELLEKARWTVNGRLYWPPEHQIQDQLELPLPEPRKPKKMN